MRDKREEMIFVLKCSDDSCEKKDGKQGIWLGKNERNTREHEMVEVRVECKVSRES
jgi:hypothetical protein